MADLVAHKDDFAVRNIRLIAVSGEIPAESRIMRDRKQAPYVFIADHNYELIDHFRLRTGEYARALREFRTVSKPTLILLHNGQEVWRDGQFRYLRTAVQKSLKKIDQVMLNAE